MVRYYTRRNSAVMRDVAGQSLLIPVRGEQANLQRVFALNPVGKSIWQALDTRQSEQQLVEVILSAFDVDESQALQGLRIFVQEMLDAGLIQRVEQES